MTTRRVITTLTATMALAGLHGSQAGAAAVQSYTYSTAGSIAGQTGVAPITFIGVNAQTLTTPGTFSLGTFDAVNMLPASAKLTYDNTPFTIALNVKTDAGTTYTYDLNGTLTGSITGSGSSSMIATIASITGIPAPGSLGKPAVPPFPLSQIQVNTYQGINAPNALQGTDGYTNLYAQATPIITPVPAPEPATIAVFGAGLVLWGFRRRFAPSSHRSIG